MGLLACWAFLTAVGLGAAGAAAFLVGWAAGSGGGSLAAKLAPHLGQVTFLPSGSGFVGLRTFLHSGQISLETAIPVRPTSRCELFSHGNPSRRLPPDRKSVV